jgi:hypothetical protein
MKCKDSKILMMDLLYDEITNENKLKLENHLNQCKDCQIEYDGMKQVPNFLNKWEEESAPLHITFTAEENSIIEFFKNLVPNFNIVKKVGFGFATILFVMALFNTKVEMNDGNFSFETSLLKTKEQQPVKLTLSPEMLEQIRYENFKLTSQLLDNYETKDEKQTLLLLNNLVTEIRKERSQDYNNLVGTVNEAYTKNDYQIRQTNHTIDEIIDLINQPSAQNK